MPLRRLFLCRQPRRCARTDATRFRGVGDFFAQPIPKKAALAIEEVGGNRGYSGLLHEALDPKAGADFKEAFNIGLDLAPDDPEILAGAPFRTLNVWPDQPGFKPTLLAYFDACSALGHGLHRAFAKDLGLPLDFFVDKLDRPMATLRLLHYPAGPARSAPASTPTTATSRCSRPTTSAASRCARAAGEWIVAPPIPGAFVVNIGDCLMRWTNDVYVSTPHRVVNRSGRERYSIAFFFDPNPEALVQAIPSCVAAGRDAALSADPRGRLSEDAVRGEPAEGGVKFQRAAI